MLLKFFHTGVDLGEFFVIHFQTDIGAVHDQGKLQLIAIIIYLSHTEVCVRQFGIHCGYLLANGYGLGILAAIVELGNLIVFAQQLTTGHLRVGTGC